MNALHPSPVVAWLRSRRGALTLSAAGAFLALLVASCSTTSNRAVVMAPAVPGASYVGSEACSQCHDSITKNFGTAAHARMMAKGPNATEIGCESCHGPASVHVESGGAAHTLVHPDKNPESCFQCHSQLRAEFSLPHRHPAINGHLGCSSCHDPHTGSALKGGGVALLSQNDACLQCHKSQQGPHIFEHEALREGCTTCHAPHGSVNQKMLTARNAILCLKCHFQQQNGPGRIAIGAIDHTSFLSRGTCWSAGCHEAVHGSQVSASLRF